MATTLVRTLILYSLIILSMRLLGKRQIGQLEPTELVISIMISDLAAVPMQNLGIPLVQGIIPIVTLFCMEMLLSILCKKSLKVRHIVCGTPSIIILDGISNQEELNRLRISVTELLEELRLKDVFDITSVSCAYLETNGQLSVLLKPTERTVTIGDMHLPTDTMATQYTTIIAYGHLFRKNLYACNKTEKWLTQQLTKAGLSSCESVYLMVLDNLGNATLIPKAPDTKPSQKDV